jgi:hypothetical protein
MDDSRRELRDVLREARDLLARPDNCFVWSSWEDADAAFLENTLSRSIVEIS